MKCVKCGAEHAEHEFKVLQVQTLHVRDLGKTSRVQALGDFEEYAVCEICTKEKYDSIVDNSAQVRKTWLFFGSLLLIGAALAYLNWNVNSVLQFSGLGLLIGGGLFGPIGMLLGVPVAASAYALLKEATDKREKSLL